MKIEDFTKVQGLMAIRFQMIGTLKVLQTVLHSISGGEKVNISVKGVAATVDGLSARRLVEALLASTAQNVSGIDRQLGELGVDIVEE